MGDRLPGGTPKLVEPDRPRAGPDPSNPCVGDGHRCGRITDVEFVMRPIGTVRNQRAEPVDDGWDLIDSRIELDPTMLDDDATAGLREFSHVEVVYVFDRVDDSEITRGARTPRGNPAWPAVGILAQRPKVRPNRIGTTVCELLTVRPGGVIEVRGLDAIDATPVLDIKPYYAEFGPRGDVRQPAWSHELMAGYWQAPEAAAGQLDKATAAAWLAEVLRSPADGGTVDMIVRRPAVDVREELEQGELDVELGLVGDNWLARGSRNTTDRSSERDAQLNIMNSRCAALVAGGRERMALAGDQLFVDLDLSPTNLPAGTRLAFGTAVIEVTAKPHTGCAKFARRFGLAAHRWVNGHDGTQHRLRGICAQVVQPGTVRRGDRITKL
jgi:tRNA (Thr-GGU) A37 N-methylase